MISRTQKDLPENESGYRVEVSGWDANERFFVEKSTLVWTPSSGKKLALNALVRTGSVLFVRLIQPLGGGTSFPVPYRAVEFEAKGQGSRGVVKLEQMQPRMAYGETAGYFADPGKRVA